MQILTILERKYSLALTITIKPIKKMGHMIIWVRSTIWMAWYKTAYPTKSKWWTWTWHLITETEASWTKVIIPIIPMAACSHIMSWTLEVAIMILILWIYLISKMTMVGGNRPKVSSKILNLVLVVCMTAHLSKEI